MLAKLRGMSSVKLIAVTLVGCLLLASCGGGEEDGGTRDESRPDTSEKPTQVTLSLSEFTQDTSQGKAISIDYSGPDFDEEELRAWVGDTPVESVFVNDQIHLMLPLTQADETSLEFEFGDFGAAFSVDITEAPQIADPPAYVSGVLDGLVGELDALSDGDWQNEIDALFAVEQDLLNLSEDEIREVAIFLKQNVEPLLLGLHSPVVTQAYDPDTCDRRIKIFLITHLVTIAAADIISIFLFRSGGIFALSNIKILTIMAVTGLIALRITDMNFRALWEPCVGRELDSLEAELDELLAFGPRVAQDGSGTISTIAFNQEEARAITITLAHQLQHERRSEVLNAARRLGNVLLKITDGMRSVVSILPDVLSVVAAGINSSINKFEGFISTFTELENLEGTELANHANFRLEGTSDLNITGRVAAATSEERLVLQFSFEDLSRVPQDGCVDFDFTLSNSRDDLEDVTVPGRLCADVPAVTIEANSISVTEGMMATFTVTFDPAPESDLALHYTVTQTGDYVSSADIGAQTLTVISGTTSVTLTVPTNDDNQDKADGAVSIMLDPGMAYQTGHVGARVTVTDNDEESDELSVEILSAACTAIDSYRHKVVVTGRAIGPVEAEISVIKLFSDYDSGYFFPYVGGFLEDGDTYKCSSSNWSTRRRHDFAHCQRGPADPPSTTFTTSFVVDVAEGNYHVGAGLAYDVVLCQ